MIFICLFVLFQRKENQVQNILNIRGLGQNLFLKEDTHSIYTHICIQTQLRDITKIYCYVLYNIY